MENGTAFEWEHRSLINELTQGMELAKQLRAHLSSTTSPENARQLLIQRVLSSFEKSLLILKWTGSVGIGQSQPVVPISPVSVNGSPRSEDFDSPTVFKDQYQEYPKDVCKKRKALPTWTEQVKICSENGSEGFSDDGYSWRKYGQKDILGAKYPRSYYRCTYRNVQNCWATKQVQSSDEDPTILEITYRGKHTCNQVLKSAPAAPQSPEKQEISIKPDDSDHLRPQPNDMLINLRASLRVDTDNLETKEKAYHPFSFPSTIDIGSQMVPISPLIGSSSPTFLSPATSESNYFSVSPCLGGGGIYSLQHSESDLTEIISANASTTNSPVVDMDFSIDLTDLDSYLQFNPGYFT